MAPRALRLPARTIFVVGYPGELGGADTECWHTIKLWRRFGLPVTVIPTWRATEKWRARLDQIGCTTVRTSPSHLENVSGLRGGVVVSFCNGSFLQAADRLRDLRCKVVWVNCMTWLFPAEKNHYRNREPFDCYVFQSQFQKELLQPQLAEFGVREEQCFRIRGAFAWEEFPFKPLPHSRGTPFVIGRISRPDPDKYTKDTWSVYRRILHPVQARVMAWDRRIEQKVGPPPAWAECLPAGAEPAQQFFGQLHCMLQINGGAQENWPRSGLEAMASGVAVVAENRWGWQEMIRHDETGYLADNDEELAWYASRLARDEDRRLDLVRRARRALEEELANPECLWSSWKSLFESLR